eukprot:ctg_4871.g634
MGRSGAAPRGSGGLARLWATDDGADWLVRSGGRGGGRIGHLGTGCVQSACRGGEDRAGADNGVGQDVTARPGTISAQAGRADHIHW